MTGDTLAATAIAPVRPRSGRWRESAGVYVLGSLLAAGVEALVLIGVVVAIWDTGLSLMLTLLGAAVALPLVPLASWIAWRCTPPSLAAPWRWLRLTAIASVLSLVVLVLVLLSLFNAYAADLAFLYGPPVVALHAWWTALFLLRRRR